MTDTDPISVATPALVKYNSLTQEEERDIRNELTSLACLPTEKWPADKVTSRAGDAYMLSGPNQLRVFFRRQGDKIVILDIALQELLDRFNTSKA
jgi:hypothetical protein